MQCKIYWKLDVQNGPVREWSLSTENQQYSRQRIGVQWAPILCPGGTEVNFVPSGDEVMLFSNGYSLP
jgi:hypothetical protein